MNIDHISAFIMRQRDQIRKGGWPVLRRKLERLPVIAVSYFAAAILRIFKVRVLSVYVSRIGHLACEPDCYIKEQRLGLHPRYRAVLCAPRGKVANQRLVEYWSQYFRVISSPWICRALELPGFSKLLRFDVSRYLIGTKYSVRADGTVIYDTATIHVIQTHWEGRPPLLSLTPEDIARGERRLLELGLSPGAWFVCVHGREGGYSPGDEQFHSHRNTDIDSYRLAMEAIAERGGWCIRIGDPSMKKMLPMQNVVDYAHHSLRADWMDLFLCAQCRFILGSSSGPSALAHVFGIPLAVTNILPVSGALLPGKQDVGIPKLLWSAKEQRLLTFPEILASRIGDMRSPREYREAGVEIIDNTPDDIQGLALEQFERTGGHAVYTATDDELQARFKALLKPGHYSYHGAESRVGRDFLRKHAALLENGSVRRGRIV